MMSIRFVESSIVFIACADEPNGEALSDVYSKTLKQHMSFLFLFHPLDIDSNIFGAQNSYRRGQLGMYRYANTCHEAESRRRRKPVTCCQNNRFSAYSLETEGKGKKYSHLYQLFGSESDQWCAPPCHAVITAPLTSSSRRSPSAAC